MLSFPTRTAPVLMTLLSVVLIGRETIRLMTRQLRPEDQAFDASYTFSFTQHDLTLPLDDFSDAYLFEAADTMVAFPAPPRDMDLPLPLHTAAARDSYRGLTLRTVEQYRFLTDERQIVMTAQYRPEPPQQEQAA